MGIQLGGAGASAAWGTFVTGPIVAGSVVGGPETAVPGIGFAMTLDAGAAKGIDSAQNFLYDKFDIR